MDDLFYQNDKQVVGVINEFLKAISNKKQAGSSMLSYYSDFNYDEVIKKHRIDNNQEEIDDMIKDFANFFDNSINYDNPGTMYNVHPDVNIYGLVASFVTSLLANPNFCMDLPSGKLLAIEKLVIDYFSRILGWDDKQAGGLFTFGGKGTLLYSLKEALNKIDKDCRSRGIRGKNYVISNDLGHPAHIEVCNWLGVGEDNCIRLGTRDGVVDPEDIKNTFMNIIDNGGKLPLIIVNGMTTNNHTFDDVDAVIRARNDVVKNRGLDYSPHVHVDSVLGWVYLLIGEYDFKNNPLNICDRTRRILIRKVESAKRIQQADSFGVDFHKTGFCSYVSSLYITKDKNDLFNIESKYSEDSPLKFSEYAPYDYSLESSRSPHGAVSAYVTMKTLGVNGFVEIIANHTEAYTWLKNRFSEDDDSIVCNSTEESNLVFMMFLPKEYAGTIIDYDTPQAVADKIREHNTQFYSYLIEQLKTRRLGLYFSCSRSYRYFAKSYGCLKLYNFNSRFDVQEAKKVYLQIRGLYHEFLKLNENSIPKHESFDFAEIKGGKSVRND